MATLTSESRGTSIFGPRVLQAVRHNDKAQSKAPANERFIKVPQKDLAPRRQDRQGRNADSEFFVFGNPDIQNS
jgi:hypothetical protein